MQVGSPRKDPQKIGYITGEILGYDLKQSVTNRLKKTFQIVKNLEGA